MRSLRLLRNCHSSRMFVAAKGNTTPAQPRGVPTAALSLSTPTNNMSTESSSARNDRQQQQQQEFDVLIVGGGVVGCSLADLLRRRLPQLGVGLVEARTLSATNNTTTTTTTTPHPRSYALSPASLQLLHLDTSNETRLGWYDSMQVWEARQPSCLSFSVQDLQQDTQYLGAVVEDGVLMEGLLASIQQSSSVKLFPETKVASMAFHGPQAGDGLVEVQLEHHHNDTSDVTTTVQTKLLVAADGANSVIRQKLGVNSVGWDYGQTALTFTAEIAAPMKGRAFQRFVETGPLALLPTYSPQHAIVVWSTTPAQAAYWKNQHPDLLCQHINGLLQRGPDRLDPLFHNTNNSSSSSSSLLDGISYGMDKLLETLQYAPLLAQHNHQASFFMPPRLQNVASPQFTFPLSCRQVTTYTPHPRVVLVGDCAHTVHPMAGQGLNLGLQDVVSLLDCMERATLAGMDPSTFCAQDYHRDRVQQVSATLAGIHTLQQLFGIQQEWGKHVKSMGMNVVQHVTPLRRALVQAACHGVNR